MRSHSKLNIAIFALAAALTVSGMARAAEITVGGKDFTEQFLIAEMTKQLLESKDYDVEKRDNMGTNIVRSALENGQIDLYWEYTGTSLVTFNKITERLGPDETYERVKKLDGEKGLVWLKPSKANNTYAMAIKPGNPKTKGWTTISDMASAYDADKDILMAATAEFPHRQDGLLGLEKSYGFDAGRANVKPMAIGLVYPALNKGDVDVATVGSTDGRIASMGLKILKDDKNFFPSYALTPVVREEALDKNPDLQKILNTLSAKLDDDTMRRLNGEVDVKGRTEKEVATEFLKAQGLI